MIVVSDTSPITNLAAIGQFELLQQLYTEIYIPDAVWNELQSECQDPRLTITNPDRNPV